MVDEATDGPPSNWLADALNPAENLRMLVDAQRFGRRAAEDLADRWAAATTAASEQQANGSAPADSDVLELMRRLQQEVMRAGDAWFDLMSDGIALLDSRTGGGGRGGRGEGSDSVALTVQPGQQASGVFWVHNPTAAVISAVRPHCGALRSHDGHELRADAVAFEPAVLDPLPARSSCGIEVRIRVPASTPPARYVSTILVANLPELSLPLPDVDGDEASL